MAREARIISGQATLDHVHVLVSELSQQDIGTILRRRKGISSRALLQFWRLGRKVR